MKRKSWPCKKALFSYPHNNNMELIALRVLLTQNDKDVANIVDGLNAKQMNELQDIMKKIKDDIGIED